MIQMTSVVVKILYKLRLFPHSLPPPALLIRLSRNRPLDLPIVPKGHLIVPSVLHHAHGRKVDIHPRRLPEPGDESVLVGFRRGRSGDGTDTGKGRKDRGGASTLVDSDGLRRDDECAVLGDRAVVVECLGRHVLMYDQGIREDLSWPAGLICAIKSAQVLRGSQRRDLRRPLDSIGQNEGAGERSVTTRRHCLSALIRH